MAKHQDPLLEKPLPSTRVPWLMILCLLAAIVLVFMGFLRRPGELLGSPLKPNTYIKYMAAPKKHPVGVTPAKSAVRSGEKPKPAASGTPAPADTSAPTLPPLPVPEKRQPMTEITD